MGYDWLATWGRQIAGRGDEQLIREWEDAERADVRDGVQRARMILIDRLNNGSYWEERKRARREPRSRSAGAQHAREPSRKVPASRIQRAGR